MIQAIVTNQQFMQVNNLSKYQIYILSSTPTFWFSQCFWCSWCSISNWCWWPSGQCSTLAAAIINPISSPGKGTKMYKAEICKIVQDCTYKIASGNSCFMGFMPPGVANLHQTPFDTKSFLFKRLLSCNGKYQRSKIHNILSSALLHNAPK